MKYEYGLDMVCFVVILLPGLSGSCEVYTHDYCKEFPVS